MQSQQTRHAADVRQLLVERHAPAVFRCEAILRRPSGFAGAVLAMGFGLLAMLPTPCAAEPFFSAAAGILDQFGNLVADPNSGSSGVTQVFDLSRPALPGIGVISTDVFAAADSGGLRASATASGQS